MTFKKFPEKRMLRITCDVPTQVWLQPYYEPDPEEWRKDTVEKLEPLIQELIFATPSTEKIEVHDSETGEAWIVKTANPDQWQSFLEILDNFVVKQQELLECLK